MSKKNRQQKLSKLIIRTAAATAIGGGLTMLLMILGTVLILKGEAGEKGMSFLLLTAVFLGSMLASALNQGCVPGAVPCVLLATGSFTFLLYLASLLVTGGAAVTVINWNIVAVVLAGSAAGLITKLVKSNKSYTKKSKWKRMIT